MIKQRNIKFVENIITFICINKIRSQINMRKSNNMILTKKSGLHSIRSKIVYNRKTTKSISDNIRFAIFMKRGERIRLQSNHLSNDAIRCCSRQFEVGGFQNMHRGFIISE